METAGIEHSARNLSLRSIRPTTVQIMAENDVHPEIMRQRTGHSSISALNTYTRFKNEENTARISELLQSRTYSPYSKLFIIGFAILGVGLLAIFGLLAVIF